MTAPRSKEFHRQRACEFLARESHVPLDEVTRLYEDEWARLALDARLSRYLDLFTVRNLRARLLARPGTLRSPGAPIDTAPNP